MTRLRYNDLKTTLGGTLTSGATSVTFAAALTHNNGTAVPTLATGDYIPFVIRDGSGNLSEIVWLTAYTAAATSGTIVRGMEGTAGVSHASGVAMDHGVTVQDLEPAGYDPTVDDPTNLYTWHRCDSGVTLTSGRVSGWAPKSGSGSFSIAGGGVGPLQSGSLHPLGSPLLFDSGSCKLTSSIVPASAAAARTIMIVASHVHVRYGDTYCHLLHYGDANTNMAYGIVSVNGSPGNHYWSNQIRSGMGMPEQSRVSILASRYDGTDDYAFCDGLFSAKNTLTLNTGTSEGIGVGSRINGIAETCQYALWEVITWQRALTNAQMISAAKKLAAYWNRSTP